jgi:hypothetical protein
MGGWVLLAPNNTMRDEIGERRGGVLAIYVGGEGITVPLGPWRFRSVREKSASSPPRNSRNTPAQRVQRERGTEGEPAVDRDGGGQSSPEGTSDGVDTETSERLFRSSLVCGR